MIDEEDEHVSLLGPDDVTPLTCEACNGRWKLTSLAPDGTYHVSVCKWCVYGCMDELAFAKWADSKLKGRKLTPYPR